MYPAIDSQQDWHLHCSSSSDVSIQAVLTRPLKTRDNYDRALQKDDKDVHVIFAWCSATDPSQIDHHGPNRGATVIDFFQAYRQKAIETASFPPEDTNGQTTLLLTPYEMKGIETQYICQKYDIGQLTDISQRSNLFGMFLVINIYIIWILIYAGILKQMHHR